LKGFSTIIGSVIQTSANVVKSLNTTLMRFINGIYSFADGQLSYIHQATIDVRKTILKHIIAFIPDEIDIESVSNNIKGAVRYLRSTVLRLSGIYRRFVTRFSSKIEYAISDFW
jgi:asparagine synthetase A